MLALPTVTMEIFLIEGYKMNSRWSFFMLKAQVCLCWESTSFMVLLFLFCLIICAEVTVLRSPEHLRRHLAVTFMEALQSLPAVAWWRQCWENYMRAVGLGNCSALWHYLFAFQKSWWTHLAFAQLICVVQKSPFSPLRDKRCLPW